MATDRYECKEDVRCFHHFFEFFRNNTNLFTIYDVTGKVWAYTLSIKGKWLAGHPDRGWTMGMHYNRAEALSEFKARDKAGGLVKEDQRVTDALSDKIIWEREVVFVDPHSGAVSKLVLNKGGALLPSDEFSPWEVVATALIQTHPTTREKHAVLPKRTAREFNATALVEEAGILPEARTYLLPKDFRTLLHAYTASINNVDNVRNLATQIDRLAPAMAFMPSHLLHVLGDYPSIGRLFLRYDLSHFEAIAKLHRVGTEFQPKKHLIEGLDLEDHAELVGGWYAFESLDRAVEIKMLAPKDVEVRVLSLEE